MQLIGCIEKIGLKKRILQFLVNAAILIFIGHNYELIVSLTGEIDKETGYVYDLGILSDLIKREIENSFDHKNLNIEVEEFKNLNPTAENIAVVIYDKLRNHIPTHLDLKITLYETPRNFVSYTGE